MTAKIIDGKAIAAEVKAEVAERVKAFVEKHGRAPGLDVVLVGDDPASQVYVGSKEKQAGTVGIRGAVHRMPSDTTQEALEAKVRELNAAPDVDGILVQLPLPKHLDSQRVIDVLEPGKDVDGLTPISTGLLWSDRPGLRPCTPWGCMRLLQHTGIELEGARAVVIGRSALVGKPIAAMLLAKNATVTLAHSRTKDLAARVREADVVIAAVGKAELVRGDWIKDGAVVIDVGINRSASGKLIGDVEYAGAAERASWITPVPGGVGPMTIAMLLSNTVDAAERRASW
ncbi:bifunctional methylenetetrahydrofolate dehydrogenase/methenyltetrahydrofolate cyclohydrolase FolD [Sandaracinus amylolyticus]|uniref:bifunctional methylenetetrahydrofolate dehydrogenase/methenyltetrahydrofolate cyclohydrolase FolD n=1 Tax=Sandaracinus amylolyticus TaxID=927083 RepID=UPI001EFF6DE7|nr:bifunctional methylenetetrahydrofolate dehydrogenase/methenyltetrahydrofolate cyclohydrolase FolD [Sandaracinus amylolyticus]UJR80812.1 Bifunctional methylenetetrahydrofolate dehydrogenase/methenyltetrahydrofolate cyclohydrolase FolD [Sandaracinus amylolyticus]